MPVFFIQNQDIDTNRAFIKNKSDLKHILSVLRTKVGDKLELISPDKEILICEITEISKELIETKILSKIHSNKYLCININLVSSILKSNAQDFLIQKATELGVNEITPVLTRYSIPDFKNDKDKEKKIIKWQTIANESCKQCERATIPVLNPINDLKQIISKFDPLNTIVCVERNAKKNFKEAVKNLNKEEQINIIIGPEGGWSDKELEFFSSLNIKQASLGNLILRAETAAIKAISNVIYEYENN